MTSEFKLSHYFLLIKVKWRHVLNTQIIQETISKHYPLCECSETFTVEYILLQSLYFSLNILKFELQYEWTHHKHLSVGIAFYNFYVTA